jgi:hypothetical protein
MKSANTSHCTGSVTGSLVGNDPIVGTDTPKTQQPREESIQQDPQQPKPTEKGPNSSISLGDYLAKKEGTTATTISHDNTSGNRPRTLSSNSTDVGRQETDSISPGAVQPVHAFFGAYSFDEAADASDGSIIFKKSPPQQPQFGTNPIIALSPKSKQPRPLNAAQQLPLNPQMLPYHERRKLLQQRQKQRPQQGQQPTVPQYPPLPDPYQQLATQQHMQHMQPMMLHPHAPYHMPPAPYAMPPPPYPPSFQGHPDQQQQQQQQPWRPYPQQLQGDPRLQQYSNYPPPQQQLPLSLAFNGVELPPPVIRQNSSGSVSSLGSYTDEQGLRLFCSGYNANNNSKSADDFHRKNQAFLSKQQQQQQATINATNHKLQQQRS